MRPGQVHRLAAEMLRPLAPCLRLIEKRLIDRRKPIASPPVLFIVGAPRTGSTILFQCLTHYFDVTFPSHLTALFPLTPTFGLWLSHQIYGNRPHHAFRSLHGFSLGDGLHGPNEWETLFRKRIFPELRQESLPQTKSNGLSYIDRILNYQHSKPMILKVPLAVLHIDTLARLIPSSKFIYVDRSPLDTARSIYRAKRREGKPAEVMWYVQPARLLNARFETEADQIVAQIWEIGRIVKESFTKLDVSRTQSVSYENLCQSPVSEIERIGRWLDPSVKTRPGRNLPRLVPSSGGPLSDSVLDDVLQRSFVAGTEGDVQRYISR